MANPTFDHTESDNLNIPPLTLVIIFLITVFISAIASMFVPEESQLIVIALPLIVIFALVALVRPEWALLGTIAIVPLEEYPVTFLPEGLTLIKVLGILLLGTFFINIIFRRRKFRFLDDTEDFMVVLFAASLLISTIFSEFPGRSLSGIERIFRMLALYVATKNLISSPKMLKSIMWTMSLGATYASLWGINEYFQSRTVLIHDIRVTGINMDANFFALVAIMALMPTIALLPITKSRWKKALLLFNMASILIAVVLTGSRGGYITLIVAGAIYILRHPKRKQLALLVLAVAVLSWPLWPNSLKARLGDTSVETPSDTYIEAAEFSAERRLAYVEFGFQYLENHLLFGAGYDTFALFFPRSDYARFSNPMNGENLERLAHNTYLDLLIGLGVVGLLIYLGLLLYTLRDLFMVSQKAMFGTLMWSASTAFMLALIAFMIATLFLSIPHMEYLWITIGIASALRYFATQNPQILYELEG